ncbi:hypothetical protein DE146DRAFT_615545 [Phaeosphaeria sp. MPI-PUGE-AT-0046c]|nr:hypothetical protein DE146DRAFT_615545 [Phaeosphaeria sp. MPI-PUGE-AT-0046c]
MAEALVAVGLAGNIIQFISFSSALVSKTKDIHKSASGVSSDLVDFDIVSSSLRDLIKPLLNNSNVSTQLYQIAERCKEVAEEILEATTDLKWCRNSSNQGPRKWRSFRKALKSIWKKEQIDALHKRLQLLRDQLSLHLISSTSENQAHVRHMLENWKNHVLQAEQSITTQIMDLDTKLREIQEDNARAFNEDDRTKLYDLCTKVQVEVQELSRRDIIIQSLRYESMEVRNDTIKNAHERTFDWMFATTDSQGATPRQTSGFAEWLQRGTGIYWITGKPGSGKSTLMKYLFNNSETTKYLQAWAGATPLVQASFYFWIPGQMMQKSIEGLLQTLLYHILGTCPDLVSILCPERSNQQHTETVACRHWTLSELQKTFQLFRLQNVVTAKFYFHIDGLDEYYGDSWDVIHMLQDLATCPNVKMCLSSRPWNSFQDAFGRSNPHVLRVHERTMMDIQIFAKETLMAYADHSEFEPSLFNDLIRDIAERAQGVFLWVRLVVHSLRNGIVNDDPVSILHERLRAIPTDLEDFFGHILESVEGFYRPRMARTFLAALRAIHPLTTIHYHFLHHEDMIFDLGSLNTPWSESEIQEVVHRTHRRLNGRFLECGFNCYIVHFAIFVGHKDYLRHRIRQADTKADLNRILKHALYLGVDPNAVVGSTSIWTVALNDIVNELDTPNRERWFDILRIFLRRSNYLDSSQSKWDLMLNRSGCTSGEGMRNTLRYLELLFSHGIDPNLASQGTTLFGKFLRTLTFNSSRLATSLRAQHQREILVAFLQAGADITQVYKDDAPEGWLPCFLETLSSKSLNATKIMEFRKETQISDFKMFLESGLNLNDVVRDNITVWNMLLGVMHQSIQQDQEAKAQHKVIHQIMLLSLQHGADSGATGLPQMMQWMKSQSCLLTAEEVRDIEKALPSSTLNAAGAVVVGSINWLTSIVYRLPGL